MDKPKPHFINPEGEEVYREKRPADNLEKLNERNIIEGYKAIEVSKKLKGEKTWKEFFLKIKKRRLKNGKNLS